LGGSSTAANRIIVFSKQELTDRSIYQFASVFVFFVFPSMTLHGACYTGQGLLVQFPFERRGVMTSSGVVLQTFTARWKHILESVMAVTLCVTAGTNSAAYI